MVSKSTANKAQALYKVAAELFSKKGYHLTSIRDIAEALDVKAGSLYYYITAKDDLLFDIVDKALDRLIAPVQGIMASNLSPTEKLRQAIASHVVLACSLSNETNIIIREIGNLPLERAAVIRDKRRSYERMFQSILRAGVESGELTSDDINITSYCILGMCNWVSQWYRDSGRLSPQEIAHLIVNTVVNGLASR